jgi:thioredoxin 2
LINDKPIDISLEVLKKAERLDDIPLVVDFWAEWCGPCRMMSPEFAKASEALKGRARFAKIDTEAYPAAGTRYAIRSIPLLVAFRNGREIGRRTGVTSARDIAEWVGAQAVAG